MRGIQAMKADHSSFEQRRAEADDFLVASGIVDAEHRAAGTRMGEAYCRLGRYPVAGLRSNVNPRLLCVRRECDENQQGQGTDGIHFHKQVVMESAGRLRLK